MLVCGHYPEPRDIELIDYGVWFELDLSNGKIRSFTTKKTVIEIIQNKERKVTPEPSGFIKDGYYRNYT